MFYKGGNFVKKKKIFAVVTVVLAIVVIGLFLMFFKANNIADNITQTKEYETVQIVCLKDSPIQPEDDFSGYNIGYINGDRHSYDTMTEILGENNKKVRKSRTYQSSKGLYENFLSGYTEMMLLTNDVKSDLFEIDESYTDKIRVLFSKDYELGTVETKAVDIATEPFTLYLCGADLSSGDSITSAGRGDVNILLTVNPNTKKVNMQVIPRDTFVNIPCRGGRSKLSYSGWWGGVQSSIDSIEDKFDVDINYYAKLNFAGLTDLVDALGGVTVYSHYTYDAGSCNFVKGENFVDGEKALSFARARKMLPENERSRGYQQMELIKGIFRKFAEDPTYDKAIAVIDSLSNNFTTNLPKEDFKKAFDLVVDILPQLQTMENHSVFGEYKWHYDEVRPTYYQYYFYPYEDQYELVKGRIDAVLEGK